MAAQLMDNAPPNVPSNGKRRGSFKGLFGFKGEPVHFRMPSCTACWQPSRIMLSQMSSASWQIRRSAAEGLPKAWLKRDFPRNLI